MKRGHVILGFVLAVLVVLAPVAMAFDTCATMMAWCEGPCGISPCAVVFSVPEPIWPGPITYLAPQVRVELRPGSPASLEPPPKFFLLSA